VRRHRHAHHHGPHARWRPEVWGAIRGLHRRLIGVVVLAILVGLVGGLALHRTGEGLCVLLGLVCAAWPLGWMATIRVARPIRELAQVGEDLEGGKLQRALMATVSHELRSPLARVRVLVEMMREGSAPPGAHDDVQAEIDGMDALVGDLLAAARIDFEALVTRDLDVLDLAGRALDLAGLPAETLVVVGEPGRLKADATLVARAVSALLDNARRYGASTVVLRVVDHGPAVRLEVLDDGPGFAPGEERRAFEPFWRGTTTKDGGIPAPRGEGLGLALVRQVAHAHGGEASAANRPEGGARVWIELPRLPPSRT
jgi:signal transduction histidine kinase